MKKQKQLGMNPSTASHRLLRDILWDLLLQTNKNLCCKCGEPMDRGTFSIEHITPWLDSHDPRGLFFDLNNIAFSHLRCNIQSARFAVRYGSREEAYQARLESSRKWKRNNR